MKKFVFTLLTLSLVMALALSSVLVVSAADEDVLYGDVNGDGKINNRDLGMLQQHLNEYEVAMNEEAADVTHDGKINNRDLGIMQQYLNGYDVDLQPEQPEPPVDDDDNIFNDTTLDWT